MNKKIGFFLLCVMSLNAADIYATFNVKAQKEAILAFTSSGTITDISTEIGDKINKGDILATLENKEQKKKLNMAMNDALIANLQALQNQNSYNRFKSVEDIMDDEKFEKIDFAKRLSDINVLKAQNYLELKQIELDKTYIKAPFSGVITAKYREIGDSVSGIQPQDLLHLMDISTVKLIVEFDSKYFGDVKVGDKFIYFVDGIKKKQLGEISKVYPTVNSKTRKISAEVITKNLMPGLFGHGTIKAK